MMYALFFSNNNFALQTGSSFSLFGVEGGNGLYPLIFLSDTYEGLSDVKEYTNKKMEKSPPIIMMC